MTPRAAAREPRGTSDVVAGRGVTSAGTASDASPLGTTQLGTTLRGFGSGGSRRPVWVRRGAVVLIAVFLVAGLVGILGVHTATTTASRNGYQLTVQYPQTGRAGLDIVWNVEVRHPGGFGKQLTIRITSDYADILEQQGISPEPASETQDAQWDYLTFTAPAGDTFDLDFDAYIQPASQQGRRAEIAVLDPHRRPLVSVNYRTRLFP